MSRTTLASLLVVLGAAPAHAVEEKITLPVSQWEQLLRDIEAGAEKPPPAVGVSQLERSVDGRFEKGLFSATLRTEFRVLEHRGHVRVPVLDGSASIAKVTLNGRATSLLREGAMYTVGVDEPGDYEVRAEFYWGEEQDRFARRLQFTLPPAGITQLRVELPEPDVEASLTHGALESVRTQGGKTTLLGYLDASGQLDLSWKRRVTHSEASNVVSESQAYALLTIGESLVSGVAAFDVRVTTGETDRIELSLPEALEVLRVEGDAVLQWYTDPEDEQRLIVLLRYLVDDETRVMVHFQHPVPSLEAPVPLYIPRMDSMVSGHVGLQAPAGIAVTVDAVKGAEELSLRELPADLAALSSVPLLTGFRIEKEPEIAVKVERNQSVELTSTVVDELQASTVLIEDGTEVTKLKLRIRNNTRQYLNVTLPPGAILTSSRLDGNPVPPAVGGEGNAETGESLMFPLRQSERIGQGSERFHYVSPGETLSEIANYYYSEPGLWRRIADANQGLLFGGTDLQVGQRLRIPARSATVEESTFVLEMAYKRQRDPLGNLGRRGTVLPELDIDTVNVTWHVYVPESLLPLSFSTNLQQFSSIRYDPVRRLMDFLRRAMRQRHAWAGGSPGSYRSILSKRKVIFQQEAQQRQAQDDLVGTFPLVGSRYRFKRILLGKEQPTMAVAYVDASVIPVVRWLALIVSAVLAFLAFTRRDKSSWMMAGGGLVVLLFLGHFVLGVNRRILWGVDLALLAVLLKWRARPWLSALADVAKNPDTWLQFLRIRNLALLVAMCFVSGVVLSFPLMLSSLVLGVAGVLWWRARGREEVAHG